MLTRTKKAESQQHRSYWRASLPKCRRARNSRSGNCSVRTSPSVALRRRHSSLVSCSIGRTKAHGEAVGRARRPHSRSHTGRNAKAVGASRGARVERDGGREGEPVAFAGANLAGEIGGCDGLRLVTVVGRLFRVWNRRGRSHMRDCARSRASRFCCWSGD